VLSLLVRFFLGFERKSQKSNEKGLAIQKVGDSKQFLNRL